jgi:hypothetical protein
MIINLKNLFCKKSSLTSTKAKPSAQQETSNRKGYNIIHRLPNTGDDDDDDYDSLGSTNEKESRTMTSGRRLLLQSKVNKIIIKICNSFYTNKC